MKTTIISQRAFHLLAGTMVVAAALPAFGETKPAKDKQSSVEAKADVIEVPRSGFTIPAKAGEGRDPFFPLSPRIMVDSRPVKNPNTPKPVTVSLTLNGVAKGADAKRYALINGKTFMIGDELDVSMGDAKVRVLCLDITEDSAIVQVGGNRQELRLKPGI